MDYQTKRSGKDGRVAQPESIRFTRGRSQVQSLPRPAKAEKIRNPLAAFSTAFRFENFRQNVDRKLHEQLSAMRETPTSLAAQQ
jgi:hypothetical protein